MDKEGAKPMSEHKPSVEEQLSKLGISLAPPTPEKMECHHQAVTAIKRWAEKVGPLGMSADELLAYEEFWEEEQEMVERDG